MGIFLFLYILLGLFMVTLFVFPYKSTMDIEKLALKDASYQIYASYLSTETFPNSVSISFYPFYDYSKNPSSWALLRLYGEDKRKNTDDDIVYRWTWTEIKGYRFKEVYERARIIEQTAYALCQRRLAQRQYPIWAPDLDTLFEWTDLPSEYEYTPFGDKYNYDVSSCKEDYCYCNKTIVWATDY